jgi:glycosyltransferase involved in cell wall biosynthesis
MPENKKPTLGIAINCQNEQSHMAATIAQFYNIADDIVVIDGGSQDNSVEWAKRMGARVFYQPWVHNHAFQKNLGMRKLNTDWVYIHDPDERLDPPLLEIIPLLITEKGQRLLMLTDVIPESTELFDCFGVPRRNILDGEQTDIYPDYQYRLWKRTCNYSEDPKDRVHVEVVGFTKRTEIDYKRKTREEPARFNINHYKTAVAQIQNDEIFDKINRGEMGEIDVQDISRPL